MLKTKFCYLLCSFLILASCSDELENETIQESIIESEIQNTDFENEETSPKTRISATSCNIYYNGRRVSRQSISVPKGATITLTSRTNTSRPIHRWSKSSRGIQIVSGATSTTATFRINSSGVISYRSTPGDGSPTTCEEFVNINLIDSRPTTRCPNRLSIQYAAGVTGCDDFLIGIYNGRGVKSVRFTYSARHITNMTFQTYNFSTPVNGTITAPLYLPSDVQQSNNIVHIKAFVTLSDGSRCQLKGKVTLNCSLGGGGNTR